MNYSPLKSGYKYVYLDTNVASDLIKDEHLFNNFLKKFPVNEKFTFAVSTYTLYEASKSKKYYNSFKRMYSVLPCFILRSYFPLSSLELDFVSGISNQVDPFILAPVGIEIEGKKMDPNSLDLLLSNASTKASLKNIEFNVQNLFSEYGSFASSWGLSSTFKSSNQKKKKFLYDFERYELHKRMHVPLNLKIDKKKLAHFKSLKILSNVIYYKFISNPTRKVSINDVVDALIMTTCPYVDSFISERNSIEILRTIQRNTNLINGLNLMTLSELR